MSRYPVLEITSEFLQTEWLGTKEKFWIKYNGRPHLFKFGRENTGENWAEKVSCELCVLLDLPHAHYELAVLNGRQGVLSPSFVEGEHFRLVHGNEIIGSSKTAEDGARIYRQREHTVSRVIAALRRKTNRAEESVNNFIGYLMLDAWIGNTDRHYENWGVVIDSLTGEIMLSPTFDHASSLGRELTDETRLRRLNTRDRRFSVEAFASKAISALYRKPTDKHPLSTMNAFSLAAKYGKDSLQSWLGKLEKISDHDFCSILNNIPSSFITEPSIEFAKRLLIANRESLLRLRE